MSSPERHPIPDPRITHEDVQLLRTQPEFSTSKLRHFPNSPNPPSSSSIKEWARPDRN